MSDNNLIRYLIVSGFGPVSLIVGTMITPDLSFWSWFSIYILAIISTFVSDILK